MNNQKTSLPLPVKKSANRYSIVQPLYKTGASVSLIGLLLFFVFACQKSSMTSSELQSYLSTEENGILKRINAQRATIEVSYFPKTLVFRNQELNKTSEENTDLSSQIDSIDYFIARFDCKTSAGLQQVDIYGSQLIIAQDTLDALDAMFVQGANTISRNFSILYAFKSYIDKRTREDKVFFVLDRKYHDSIVEFLASDINRAQKIKIVN